MSDQAQLARRFLELHEGGAPLLAPNPWDAGSVTRDEALANAAAIAAATPLPVTADLENGYADDPAGVAETVRLAIGAGLAGCSIEDFNGDEAGPIDCLEHAVARIAAAAEAAHAGPVRLVLTARGENHTASSPRPAGRSTS